MAPFERTICIKIVQPNERTFRSIKLSFKLSAIYYLWKKLEQKKKYREIIVFSQFINLSINNVINDWTNYSLLIARFLKFYNNIWHETR